MNAAVVSHSRPLARTKRPVIELSPTQSFKVGDCRIDSKCILGNGEFSTVYAGLDKKSLEPRAVKIVNCNKRNGEGDSRQMYDNERDAFDLLECAGGHPNIVRCYFTTFVEKSRLGWFVLERLPTQTLADYLDQHGKLEPREALNYFLQLVEAVAKLHDLGISVRDIKAENISFDPTKGVIKLFDLGFAVIRTPGQLELHVTGSPLFMAPEVLRHMRHDTFVADMWQLGHVFYAMLVGEPAFAFLEYGGTLSDLRRAATNPAAITYPRTLDLDYIMVLRGLLTVDPVQRLTMANLLHSLRQMQAKC